MDGGGVLFQRGSPKGFQRRAELPAGGTAGVAGISLVHPLQCHLKMSYCSSYYS